jgi:hypothetical protein
MFSWWKKYIYILCVPHKNNCKKKIGSHDMKQTYSSIIIVRNVCVLTSASMIFFFSSQGHDRQSSDQNFSSWGYDWQSSEQNNRKLISLHNNGEDDKHAHRFLVVGNIFRLETCMNSLVKVLPYSKLNFQGNIFFTQNWCNITLRFYCHFWTSC